MEITLTLPPPLNETYKIGYKAGHGMIYKTAKCREWENESLWTIKAIKKPLQGLKEDVYVSIVMFVNRDRDIDSCIKIVLDLLEKAGFYQNDKYIKQLNILKYQDKKNPRLEIQIEKLKI